jgi:hypothetical protein
LEKKRTKKESEFAVAALFLKQLVTVFHVQDLGSVLVLGAPEILLIGGLFFPTPITLSSYQNKSIKKISLLEFQNVLSRFLYIHIKQNRVSDAE